MHVTINELITTIYRTPSLSVMHILRNACGLVDILKWYTLYSLSLFSLSLALSGMHSNAVFHGGGCAKPGDQ